MSVFYSLSLRLEAPEAGESIRRDEVCLFLFAQVCRKNFENVPIFGNGSPRDDDAFLGEEGFDFCVGERFFRIFLFDERPNSGLNAAGGDGFALVDSGETGAEEGAKFKNAEVTTEVFAVDCSRDCREMYAAVFRNIFHFEGKKCAGAFQKKILLAGDDGSGDLKDGLLSVVDGFDEISPLAKAPREILAQFDVVGSLGHHFSVVGGDGELGNAFSGKSCNGNTILDIDDDIGNNDVALSLRVGAAGVGIEAGYSSSGLNDILLADAYRLGGFRISMSDEVIPVFFDQLCREAASFVESLQLQQEAFSQVDGSHAGRFQLVDDL